MVILNKPKNILNSLYVGSECLPINSILINIFTFIFKL